MQIPNYSYSDLVVWYVCHGVKSSDAHSTKTIEYLEKYRLGPIQRYDKVKINNYFKDFQSHQISGDPKNFEVYPDTSFALTSAPIIGALSKFLIFWVFFMN